MDRFSGVNYHTVGGKRLFQDENLGTATEGSFPDARWFNGTQESICLPIEATGQVLDTANDLQLFEAMGIIGGGRISPVSASGPLLLANGGIVLVNAAGGSVVLTLPFANVASGFAVRYEIIRTDTSGNNVTVVPSGGDVWGFGAAGSMPVFNGSPLTIVSDGTSKWHKRSSAPEGFWVYSAGATFAGRLDLSLYFGEVWGAGGGGGGSTTVGGTGGSGGGYAAGLFTMTPASTAALTIGAGGTAGIAAGADGGNGGTSSLGSFMSATGGGGGITNGFGGGGPGTGSGGTLNLTGMAGQNPTGVGGGVLGGQGGGSFKMPPAQWTSGGAGFPGPLFGVGGGGAASVASSFNGGVGSGGLILIRGIR